jgi:hypothetical protein
VTPTPTPAASASVAPTATILVTPTPTPDTATAEYQAAVVDTLQVGVFAIVFGLALVIALLGLQAAAVVKR